MTPVPTTVSNQLPTCLLPASGITQGSGGWISVPGGNFTLDKASDVPIPGQQDTSGLKRGYTWDPTHLRWLPVPREWVQPDFSSYIYPVSQGGAIHEVNVAKGSDVVYPMSYPLDLPIAIRSEGLYIAGGPMIFHFVDRGGITQVVDQGKDGLSYVVSPGAYWATEWGTAPSYGLTDAARVDAVSGITRVWFHRPQPSWTLSFDRSGNPIVAVGTRNNNTAHLTITELWVVPQPSTGDVPSGRLLFYNPDHPLVLNGAPIESHSAIWFATTTGVYGIDSVAPNAQLQLASTYTGWISGGCR